MSRGRSPVKSAARACVAAGLLLCAGTALGQTPAAAAPPVEGVVPEAFVVVPFDNESKVKQLDWMRSALAVTAAEKLEALPSLRPGYGPAVLDGMPAVFDAAQVARRAHDSGARWVLGGAFSRPNWKSELRLRLYEVVLAEGAEPSLRLVAEEGSVGERDKLLEQLDALLLALVGRAAWKFEPEHLTQLKRKPTRDLYAFTIYGRALNLVYGLGGPKDLKKAQKTILKAARIDPKFAEARRLLGLVYLSLGDKGRGAGQYEYALELKPGYYAAQAGLVRIYRAEGQRQKALELCEKALEWRPYDVEMRSILGELLWESGDLDRALVELERVVAVAPRHLQTRRTLALVHAARGETQGLARELELVAELLPDDVEVKLDLASAYQRMGDYPRATALYEDLTRRQPKNGNYWKLLGDTYRRRHDLEHAIATYGRLRRLHPDDPRGYLLLAAVYVENGEDSKAEAVLQEAQQFRRYLGEVWTNLGSIAYRKGDLSRASWYLTRAVDRAPRRPKTRYNYALVLAAKQERDAALAELAVAAELDPNDPEVPYLAGVLHLREGRLAEARKAFQAALERRPDHADARHNLALLEDLERRYGGEHGLSGAN
jgi:Flp pilus assembly protein TadD